MHRPVFALSAVALTLLAGCSNVVVRPVGHTLIETNAGAAMSEAFQQAASRLQQPQLYDDDQTNNAAIARNIPFESHNRNLGDDTGKYWERGVSTFADSKGVKYTVESTAVRGRLTLWSFDATDLGAARTLRDEVARRTVAIAHHREP